MKNRWITAGLIALSVLMTAAGLMQGQAASVLVKAATICLECVGIG